MIYKINKRQIIEEARSSLANSGKVLEHAVKQNKRLGDEHKTSKTNLNVMRKNALEQQGDK